MQEQKFDWNQARWYCPKCHEDALYVTGNGHFTDFWLKCQECGFDSKRDLGFHKKKAIQLNEAVKFITENFDKLQILQNRKIVQRVCPYKRVVTVTLEINGHKSTQTYTLDVGQNLHLTY